MTMAAPGDTALYRLATQVGRRLRKTGELVVTAESCTGGFLAKCLTDLSGSSDYFDRGWVTYSDAAKRKLLGVSPSLLERHGAVSEPTALAMARGALAAAGATVAVAVTGIAGPTGATPGKPVGTVWIAWARRHRGRVRATAQHHRFTGDRDAVRRRTVAAALSGLLQP
jgi:nicotinamide-nucleotide amidase